MTTAYSDSDLIPPASRAGLEYVRVLPLKEPDRVYGVPLCRLDGKPLIILDIYVIIHPAPPRPVVEAPASGERQLTTAEIEDAIRYGREMRERQRRMAERRARRPKPLKSIFEAPPTDVAKLPARPPAPEARNVKLADGHIVRVVDEDSANRAYARWMNEQLARGRSAPEQQPGEAPPETAVVTTTLAEMPDLFYDAAMGQIRSPLVPVVTTTGAAYTSMYPSEEHEQTPVEVLAMMARSHISLIPKEELASEQRVWMPSRKDLAIAEAGRLDAMQTQNDLAILRNAHDRLAQEQARKVAMAGQRAQQQMAADQLAFARRQADYERREREAYRKQQLEGGPRMDLSDFGEFNSPGSDLDFFGRPKKKGR
jgi:hypothetical protein